VKGNNVTYERIYSITLNFNKPDLTLKSITSLLNGTLVPEEIIVIGDGSNEENFDLLSEYLRNLPIRILRLEKNLGIPGALNVGLRVALEENADMVLIIHNDVIAFSRALEFLLYEIRENPNMAAIDARQIAPGNPDQIIYDGGYLLMPGFIPRTKTSQFNSKVYEIPLNNDNRYIEFSAALVRAEAILDTNFLKPEFFITWEDGEWSIRAKKLGWTLGHSKSALVEHSPGQTIGTGVSENYFKFAITNHRKIVKNFGTRIDLVSCTIFWIIVALKNIAKGNLNIFLFIIRKLFRTP